MNELSPKLRFSEFINKWNKNILGKLSDVRDGTHDSPKYVDKGYPLITSKNLNENGILDFKNVEFITQFDFDNINRRSKVDKGDIIFGMIGTIGNPVLLNRDDFAIKNVALIKEKDELKNTFLIQYLKSNHISRQIYKENVGGTQKFISLGIIRNFEVFLPSIEEQNKISVFLSNVDNKINQLSKKKELLEKYKKGIMQKVFNQEIRFKDENGNNFSNWKTTKLKNIISKFIVPMRDKPKELNGEIPWCRIEDFEGKYLTASKTNQGVSLDTIKNMNLKVYPINTLLVSCSANLGFCAIVKKELVTNQTFIGLYPDEKLINVEFLYYVMKLSARKLNVLSSGTTISYLSREEFENFNIEIPVLAEQIKIANLLSAIDDKINNVVIQLEKTKEFKNGLLQQMLL